MPNDIEYLVKIDGDTAQMAVSGKASYMNCRNAGEFFSKVAQMRCKHLVIDLAECLSMDSTFLGMIAGAALRLRKDGADVVLMNLNPRNRQLVENLGIYKNVKIHTIIHIITSIITRMEIQWVISIIIHTIIRLIHMALISSLPIIRFRISHRVLQTVRFHLSKMIILKTDSCHM